MLLQGKCHMSYVITGYMSLVICHMLLQATALAMLLRQVKYTKAEDVSSKIENEMVSNLSSSKSSDNFKNDETDRMSNSTGKEAEELETADAGASAVISLSTKRVTNSNSRINRSHQFNMTTIENKRHSLQENKDESRMAHRTTLLHWRSFALLGYNLIWGCSSAIYVLLPKYVQQNGVSPQQTATLFIIAGLTSFGTRIFIAVTGNKQVITPFCYFQLQSGCRLSVFRYFVMIICSSLMFQHL